MFYNYRNEIVAIIEINNPYIYDMTDKVYHTMDCSVWNDTVNHHYHTDLDFIKDCVNDECNESSYDIKVCPHCYAKAGTAHNGKDFTVKVVK